MVKKYVKLVKTDKRWIKMVEENKSFLKHLEVSKILLVLFFVVIIIIFQYVYENLFSESMLASVDVFPQWISSIDASILLQINPALTNTIFNVIFTLVTFLGGGLAIMIFLLIVFLLGYKKEATLIFTSLIVGTIVVFLLKTFVLRPRPYLTLPTVIPLEYELGSSFPSGHSERIFALTSVLTRKKSKISLVLYLLASFVAFSRVYLGVHYPLDVFVGSVIGWVLGKVVLKQEKRILEVASQLETYLHLPRMHA